MGRTARPEDRSFPWSCSGDTVPFHYASGLQKTDVEIRQNQVVQGDQETRKGASEDYACILGEEEQDKPSAKCFWVLSSRTSFAPREGQAGRARVRTHPCLGPWLAGSWKSASCCQTGRWAAEEASGYLQRGTLAKGNTFTPFFFVKKKWSQTLLQPGIPPGTAAGDSGPVRDGVTLAGEPTGDGEGPRMPGR